MPADLSHAVSVSTLSTAGITIVTFIVLGLALLTSWVDRRFAVQTLDLQEKKLQRSEAYLAEAQRLSHTGSFGWKVSTGEIIWSEETFRIFQYDRATRPTLELVHQRVHPDDAALVKRTIDRASQDGKDFDYEYRLVMPDGSVKYVHVVTHALSTEPGSIEFVGAVTDTTKTKLAQESLRQAQADLAHINRVTTMGELAASLAHEIKQPISAVHTNAKTCLRWLGRDQPDIEEAREAVSRILQNITRASEIISRIRVLFKKEEPQRDSVDVNEVIREMISLLLGEAGRHAVSIHTELAPELPKVSADRVQLQQVLMNLMLNGIEAISEGKVAGNLTIKSQQNPEERVLISVSDSGIGLPPERADKVFDAFFTTKPQGTGMGLSISRSIIESHGGRLWATGNPDGGATFQFTLPVEPALTATT
jgi:C4-dicarboxylate-specific signal transduction histidine kinase